jgi:DNA invertase Pin-like site-specific DNA recombinase
MENRTVGYIRVSTPGQASEGESLKTQVKEIQDFAKYKKLNLLKIYEDKGISGSKAEKRPGFMALMADAEKKAFDSVLFTKLSRFARNARDYQNYSHELKKYGVELFSIKENIDPTTHNGRLMINLMVAIAEWEREAIEEQMSENKMAKWREKRIFNGKPPFGYLWNKKSCRLEVNPEEAKIYKRIVKMYVDERLSMGSIALKLRDEKIKCKKEYFRSPGISYILKNPAYYGYYVVNRHVYVDGKRTKKIKSAEDHIQFDIPFLIQKTEWDRIQKRTELNKVRSKRSSNVTQPYWLRDLLICGECGGAVKPRHGSKRKDGTFPRYYTCYWTTVDSKTLSLSNRQKCHLPFIKAEQIEQNVWSRLMIKLTHFGGKEKLEPLISPASFDEKIAELQSKMGKIEKLIKGKETARKNIYSLLEDVDFDKDEFQELLKTIKDELLSLKAQISETELDIAKLEEAKANDRLFDEFRRDKSAVINRVIKILNNLKPDDRKQLAEGMTDGKLSAGTYLNEDGTLGVGVLSYPNKFNELILKNILDNKLDKNGYQH